MIAERKQRTVACVARGRSSISTGISILRSVSSLAAAFALALLASCHGGPPAAMTELIGARQLAGDLRVQFNKAADASNRAVMADTDEESISFAHEAEQTTETVQSDLADLGPRLRRLGYPDEIRSLAEFAKHFDEYLELDRSVLKLAVENTNLKAQRLSFGPGRAAADGLRDSLGALAAEAPSKDRCRVESLVAKGVLAVREIQVLQAPHIAEPDDAAMTRMETEMHGLEATTSDALNTLARLVEPKTQPDLAAASAAFEQFKAISDQIVSLSRRNSNVRSLSLSLREKPPLTAACDASLRALQDALANEGFSATR